MSKYNTNANKITASKVVAAVATGALIFGTAYGAATLHTPLGAPILTASVFSLGLLMGTTFKGKRKAEVTA
ncbi:hypothetical protein NTE_01778 [Candidatus Nitrososphaera evergladensis SR1]|uniref:Uncharacterized protein n=1 Tax=Candidatus Nitrososphaera evergladensis SR1 TaxID=1459636 RepID=A0A075MX30_9ARCH|nr:hypothetical protein [Candidatus Nitrososphaera evergladensis]AIF83839.1 hypothetical protein NTE_01778 [Candidatus Nitrososphaera evergladensis SR1]